MARSTRSMQGFSKGKLELKLDVLNFLLRLSEMRGWRYNAILASEDISDEEKLKEKAQIKVYTAQVDQLVGLGIQQLYSELFNINFNQNAVQQNDSVRGQVPDKSA